MIFRFLFLLAVFWVVSRLLRSLFAPTSRRPGPGYGPRRPREQAGGPRPAGGELVQDPQCGVYIPKETALRSGDAYFCSEECRSAHRARRS